MLQYIFPQKQDSIGTQILVTVFSIYFMVALTVTLVHMVVEYFTEKENIINDLQMFHKAFSPGVSQLVWDMERRELQRLLQGMLETPIILGVKVTDDADKILAGVGVILDEDGQTVTLDPTNNQLLKTHSEWAGVFHVKLPLQIVVQANDIHIGDVTIYSSSNIILHKVRYAYMLLVGNALIKTMALWFIFQWVQRTMLAKPLSILTRTTTQLSLDQLDGLTVEVKTRGRNELKILEEAFNSMIQKMIMAKNALMQTSRMEHELQLASSVQMALLPKEMPDIAGLEFGCYFQSASETGGDWYGYSHLDKYLYMMIGDVTGHGSPAALVTATASSTCRTLEAIHAQSGGTPTPAELMSYLNHTVFLAGSSKYLMTFFIMRIDLDTGETIYSNAGHNFPVLVEKDKKITHILNTNQRLGHSANYSFNENKMQLHMNDLIFFYTDGLIENQNPEQQMWGERRLYRSIKKHLNEPVQQVVESVVADLLKFTEGTPPDDDVTVLSFRVNTSFTQGRLGGYN